MKEIWSLEEGSRTPNLDIVEVLRSAIVEGADTLATTLSPVSEGPTLLRRPIYVERDPPLLVEARTVDEPTSSVVFVLGSPLEDDRVVGKSEGKPPPLPGGKNVVLGEPIPVVCGGVKVAASVLCAVCNELDSWVRLCMGLDILLDIPLVVPLATDGEPVA